MGDFPLPKISSQNVVKNTETDTNTDKYSPSASLDHQKTPLRAHGSFNNLACNQEQRGF